MTLESSVATDTYEPSPERGGPSPRSVRGRRDAIALAPPHGDVGTRFSSRVSAAPDADTSRWIGTRLRSIREQKRLSLVDVERLSGGDLGTSTVGAYERGDRAISIPRLDRIADFYGVPIEQFLPRPASRTPTATRTSPIAEPLRVDLGRLEQLDGDAFDALQRFVADICCRRAVDATGVITLRGADAVVVAAMFAVSTESILGRLRALDIAPAG